MRRVDWRLAVVCAAVLLCAIGAAGFAQAAGDRFDIDVTVALISDEKGKIDPRGKRLDGELRKQFRYNSLRVVKTQNFDLGVNEIGTVKLPDGKKFSVSPMNLGDRGLLMALEWSGTMMMDMNAKSDHLLVIGGPEYQDARLVIGVEPHY